MLLPHPKYKGSFIALPAPSFSSKLIASETWMTLESEAPPSNHLWVSQRRGSLLQTQPVHFPSREDVVQGFASLDHTPATQRKLLPPLHPDTLLCSQGTWVPLLSHIQGMVSTMCNLHATPHMPYLQRQQRQVLGMLRALAACVGMLSMQLPKTGQLSSW